MKKNLIYSLTAIILLCFCKITQSQNNKKELGEHPGLGSSSFIMVDTIFHFSPSLNVQGKIYYKEYAQRYKTKQTGEEKTFPIKNILLACDTSVLSMLKEREDSIIGGISAIKISSNNLWHTMYGETQIFGDSTEIRELGGRGIKEGFYYVYICPTEQPCFSLRVKVNKEQELINELKNFYSLWNKVGLGLYSKKS